MSPTTQRLPDTQTGHARAAALLRQGGLVAFPTETVYGLGADARNDTAIAGIYEAKGRPAFNPLIVHIARPELADTYVSWTDVARRLADAFWPGPLTLVLPLRAGHGVSPLVTAGLETLALRVPSHPTAQALLAQFQGPVAAPSANPSGRISATTADHVVAGLDGKIDAVLDGGPCPVGLESTIIGEQDGTLRLLRAGGIPTEEIEALLGAPLDQMPGQEVIAPGQLASHYAPDARVRLNAVHAKEGEVHLGFGEIKGDRTLSASGDVVEAATNLFTALHWADAQHCPIAVAPIPNHGLGHAVNDRLRRAAAPRQ